LGTPTTFWPEWSNSMEFLGSMVLFFRYTIALSQVWQIMLHSVGTDWRKWWRNKGFRERFYHNNWIRWREMLHYWDKVVVYVKRSTFSSGSFEKNWCVTWRTLGLLGHTCSGWFGLPLFLCTTFRDWGMGMERISCSRVMSWKWELP
jgi:hypothetical protein